MNRVCLVGAGVGAGLITLRGAALVKECDCIVYDSLLNEEILSLVKPGCVKIFAGKRAGKHAMRQEEISALLVQCGKKYPLTVRLKGGDPYVFGRGGEEMAALKSAGVWAESVPGVTSAVAAAELAGIPVTHRGLSRGVHIVTAHTADKMPDFAALAKERDTLVFLMGKANAAAAAEGLIAGGMDPETPAAAVSSAGSAKMQALRGKLRELPQMAAALEAPLVLVVGSVCALDLRAPCAGRMVVTGTKGHTDRLSAAFAALGVRADAFPYMRLIPLPMKDIFARVQKKRWLVFTSANGVEIFFSRAKEEADFRAFADTKFAVIGPATASALKNFGFRADFMPREYTCAALAAGLREAGVSREEALLLRSAEGDPVLAEAGEQADLYRTQTDEALLAAAYAALGQADGITFSSAAGARAFLQRYALPAGVRVAAIGQETARAAAAFGVKAIVAKSACAQSLAEAAARFKEEP